MGDQMDYQRQHLNDDCLSVIFDYITTLEDYVVVSNVCTRWNELISRQFRRLLMDPRTVKCVLCASRTEPEIYTIYIARQIDFTRLNIQRLLPNIKVMEVNFRPFMNIGFDRFEEISRNNHGIKGIVCDKSCYNLSMIACFPDLEMLVCTSLIHNQNYPFDISRLKQLFIRKGSLRLLSRYGHTLGNLLRLHIYQDRDHGPYLGSPLTNLKVLEYDTDRDQSDLNRDDDGFDLVDQCPSLQSVYLTHRTKNVQINTSIVNTNLRDLVIQQKFANVHGDRFPYTEILSKFPNLKHLAIRNANDIDDSDVLKFLEILPNIELLDFKGSLGVTQKTVDHCAQSGQTIRVLIGPRLEQNINWTHPIFREKIRFQFNFMRHCFPRIFDQLPVLMIPDDC